MINLKKCVIQKNNLTLYYYGDITLLDKRVIAVVGKREVDEEALKTSYQVGQWLAQNNFVILNGLAVGCDKRAIEGALSKNGKVIAVLPCGIDTIYPSSCKELSKEVIYKGGLIISQFPRETEVSKRRFIERDKTQAILSNKVISIYCDETGGTMHTLKYAKKEEKEIGCVMNSSGNTYAIRNFHAKRLTNKNEIVDFANSETYSQMSLFDSVNV